MALNKILDHINEIRDALTYASLNYDIWRIYTTPKYRKKFIKAMNNYDMFFHTSTHAHFLSIIIPLYRIYETRKDSYHIYNLINDLKMLSKKTKKIENKIKKAKLLWLKICKLRNEVYGHRKIDSKIEEIFKETGIKPIDLKNLIKISKSIINEISYLYEKSSMAFNLNATKDTCNLLQDLMEYNQ